MKTKLTVGVLILLLVGGGYWGLSSAKQLKSATVDKASISTGEIAPEESTAPLIDDQGGLQVSATWEKQEGSSIQKFSVNLNNHSVDVDKFDFTKNIQVLLNGKEVPITVKVLKNSGSGHHLGTELQVESPDFAKAATGSVLTLSIKNVYGTPTRNFSWKF